MALMYNNLPMPEPPNPDIGSHSVSDVARWVQNYRTNLALSKASSGSMSGTVVPGLSVSLKSLNIVKIGLSSIQGPGSSEIDHSYQWVNFYRNLLGNEIKEVTDLSIDLQTPYRAGITYPMTRFGETGQEVKGTRSLLSVYQRTELMQKLFEQGSRGSSLITDVPFPNPRPLVDAVVELIQAAETEMRQVVAYNRKTLCMQRASKLGAGNQHSDTMQFVLVEPELMAQILGLINLKDMFSFLLPQLRLMIRLNGVVESFMLNHTLTSADGNAAQFSRLELVRLYGQAHGSVQSYLETVAMLESWFLLGDELVPNSLTRSNGYPVLPIDPIAWASGLISNLPDYLFKQEKLLAAISRTLPTKMKAVTYSLSRYYHLVKSIIDGEKTLAESQEQLHQNNTLPLAVPEPDEDDDDDDGEFVDVWPAIPAMQPPMTIIADPLDSISIAPSTTKGHRRSQSEITMLPPPPPPMAAPDWGFEQVPEDIMAQSSAEFETGSTIMMNPGDLPDPFSSGMGFGVGGVSESIYSDPGAPPRVSTTRSTRSRRTRRSSHNGYPLHAVPTETFYWNT